MDATFWALVALVIFIGLLIYLNVHSKIGSSLDERADKIKQDLDEARRLREEAQEMLAEYQRKRKEAEKDAEDIVASAKREAQAIEKEAREKTEEFVKRRNALAEQKIEHAQSEAVAEVRSAAVDIAINAASKVIDDKASGEVADKLIKDSIAQVKSKLG